MLNWVGMEIALDTCTSILQIMECMLAEVKTNQEVLTKVQVSVETNLRETKT